MTGLADLLIFPSQSSHYILVVIGCRIECACIITPVARQEIGQVIASNVVVIHNCRYFVGSVHESCWWHCRNHQAVWQVNAINVGLILVFEA